MQKIYVINWKRKEDSSNSSMYSKMFIEKATDDSEIIELFLKTSYGDLPKQNNINQIGPFDSNANKFFGRESMKLAFNKYILDKIYSFVNSTIVIFDPRVIEFLPPILAKECRIVFIQAYEHHFSQNHKLIKRLTKNTFLKDNVDLTVSSCPDDHYLFKSLFDLRTTNMKAYISSPNTFKKKPKSSNRFVMFYGDYDSMNWRKTKKLLASINKKGIVYSHSKSSIKDAKRYEDDRLKFISSEKEFLKYAKDSVLLNPLETGNIGPCVAQSLALGIPLMLFEQSEYTDELIGNNDRGIYVDFSNPEISEIKVLISKSHWATMSKNCLELFDDKYSKELFNFSVEKIIRRSER